MWNEGGIIFGVTVLEDKDPTGGYLQCSLNANLTMSHKFPLHKLAHISLLYTTFSHLYHLLLAKKKKKKRTTVYLSQSLIEDSTHQLPPSTKPAILSISLIPSLFWKLKISAFLSTASRHLPLSNYPQLGQQLSLAIFYKSLSQHFQTNIDLGLYYLCQIAVMLLKFNSVSKFLKSFLLKQI